MVNDLVLRKIVEIEEDKCNGCGECIPNCAEGALKIIDGKAKLVSDVYCDGLGACLGHCPQDAIKIIKREASEFDEDAVHEYLKSQEEPTIACKFTPSLLPKEENVHKTEKNQASKLEQWPVQIHLVPIKAPFWENADLLLMADCVAVALPELHNKLIDGRSVLIGCPKFDDAQKYLDKLTQIIEQNAVRSLTVANMDVPCCSGLRRIAELALEASGKMIPTQNLIIGVKGEIKRV
ncbi:4Fe-4S ferredoxin [Candidatus Bathyarchaeota archaeon]|nr:4Fe-4S ferredoxin [Candidatus Bathyarchaeota archaeon]